MLVLAMQFSRSADADPCGAESGDEDAGAATGARRRSLEVKEGRSLKTEERNGRRARARPSGGKHLPPTTVAVDRTERGSNWESSLRVQEP